MQFQGRLLDFVFYPKPIENLPPRCLLRLNDFDNAANGFFRFRSNAV
jgi:hypothetical protein